MLNQQRFPRSQLRLLWELAEQGYEIEFFCPFRQPLPKVSVETDKTFATQGEEIICRLRCGEKESSAVSNNASSALYAARHNFKQLWGE